MNEEETAINNLIAARKAAFDYVDILGDDETTCMANIRRSMELGHAYREAWEEAKFVLGFDRAYGIILELEAKDKLPSFSD